MEIIENNISQLFGRVFRVYRNTMHDLLHKSGLHRGQPPLLFALYHHDGMTHGHMAEALEVTPATVSNMVKRLEQAGFVERRRDPHDERVSRIFLTAKARSGMREVEQTIQNLEACMFKNFTPHELETLEGLLERMHTNLTATE